MERPVILMVRVWELAAPEVVIWQWTPWRLACATWPCPPRLKALRWPQQQWPQQQQWWPQPQPRLPTRQPPPAQPPRQRLRRRHAAVDVSVPRTTRLPTTTTLTINTSWQHHRAKLSLSPSTLLIWNITLIVLMTGSSYTRALVLLGLHYLIRPAGRQTRAP